LRLPCNKRLITRSAIIILALNSPLILTLTSGLPLQLQKWDHAQCNFSFN